MAFTVPPGALFDKGNFGWCGEQDFCRMNAFNLTDYDAIAYYDNDVELSGGAKFLPLFRCIDAQDTIVTTTGGVGEPVNVGFFALKPKQALMDAALQFSRTAGYSEKHGWGEAGWSPNGNYFIGGECGQGYEYFQVAYICESLNALSLPN